MVACGLGFRASRFRGLGLAGFTVWGFGPGPRSKLKKPLNVNGGQGFDFEFRYITGIPKLGRDA